jgi:hypothetical protein
LGIQDRTDDPTSGVSVGMIVIGALTFPLFDVVVLVFMRMGGGTVLSTAVLPSLAVFVGGLLLVLTPYRATRSFGIGVLLAWAVVTVINGGTLL